MDPVASMNRIYRYQRHVYDVTRVAFLFGRDALLRRMRVGAGDRVLEVGCGTARNLAKLQERCGDAELFGLDASDQMLETARSNLRRRGLAARVRIVQGVAEELSSARQFGVPAFDVVFFSYALSMMPASTRSIDAALASLKPGGSLHIVDFCDLAGFPKVLRGMLQRWLSLFGVAHRPELYAHLEALAARGRGKLTSQPFAGRYGVWVEFEKANESSANAARALPTLAAVSVG
jgi:S-adenosylmethionine-diacylgycerolhomoserine-N-methlytransferase